MFYSMCWGEGSWVSGSHRIGRQLFEASFTPNKNLLPTGLGLKKDFTGSHNWKAQSCWDSWATSLWLESGLLFLSMLPSSVLFSSCGDKMATSSSRLTLASFLIVSARVWSWHSLPLCTHPWPVIVAKGTHLRDCGQASVVIPTAQARSVGKFKTSPVASAAPCD